MGKINIKNLNHLLSRQIRKSKLNEKGCGDDNWHHLLSLINQSYHENDQSRYLMERSMRMSSNEIRQLHEQQTQSIEERIRDISDAIPDMLIDMNSDGIVQSVLSSSGFEDILIDDYLISAQQPLEFLLEEKLAETIRKNLNEIQASEEIICEYSHREKNEKFYEIRLIQSHKNSYKVYCLIRDITELAKSRKELEQLVKHDTLTQLPNRFFFYKTLKETLISTLKNGLIGGILFFDLDRFKSVNDSLSHQIGDQLIIAVANRINQSIAANEFLARMSGDEFIIIVTNVRHEYEILDIAERVLSSFNEPFALEEHHIETKASIGVSFFPRHSINPDELTQFADTAMYSAKESGGNQIKIFSKKQASVVQTNFKLEQDLRKALKKEEIFLVYQPQFNIQTSQISGLEALIRWKPRKGELISPGQFLPIAELTGFIDELGLWIIQTVCKQICHWKKNKLNFKKVSINLSRSQLINFNLSNYILSTMRQYYINSKEVVFEITEDSNIKNNTTAIENLRLLNDAGIGISIDDFGSGYSSFSDLKRFPFSELKIDKSVIDGIGKQSNDDAIVRAIIAMGRELNMRTIAEGVETEQQLEFLKNNNCVECQGFYLSKPLTQTQVENLLQSSY